jgi:uncharacterized damage-inducible protein DinB
MTRTDTRSGADERATLTGFLDHQRAGVHEKCAGLTDEGGAFAPLGTSPLMTIGALVNHLRWVEYDWFEHVLLGRPDTGPWTDEEPDREFTIGTETPIAEVLAGYAEQCARSGEIAAARDLDTLSELPHRETGEPFTLRWIVAHMIEETARHLGHLDILREKWDGATGH